MSQRSTEMEYTDIKKDIQQFKDDLVQLKRDMSGLSRDTVQTAKQGLRDGSEYMSKSLKSAADKGRDAAETVGDQVATHPLTSLATAFGVGLILGLGLSRKG